MVRPVKAPKSVQSGFSAYLRERSNAAGAATKGMRTRDRIVAAAADLLAADGYHSLRLSDIAKTAEVSPASIYQYYKNKTEIALEVMREFLGHMERELLWQPLTTDPYADILDANIRYIRLYRENAGLMRSLRVLSEEIPEFGATARKTFTEWRRRLARNLMRWSGAAASREPIVNLTAHALALMGTEFLYELYVRRDPAIADWADKPEALAEFFSAHWYRAATGSDPEPKTTKKKFLTAKTTKRRMANA